MEAQAGYAFQGQGIRPVMHGTVANSALYMESRPTWSNAGAPEKPYVVDAWFALPVCDSVPASRLILTVWGGTASYVCHLAVRINGTNLAQAFPLVFGTTSDSNIVFSAASPSVYGAGSGVWVIGLPVPGGMLLKNGDSNRVQVTVTTPDSFDGRINQVSLVAVCQSNALNNTLEYVVAEGSGDIYRAPTGLQVDARTVPCLVDSASAVSARLRALYTYGDIGQNDRLFFNGLQLGGDDVAGWDKNASGLDYGPNVVSYDVLSNLASSNAVRFSVATSDVPGTRETSLRPQLAVLEVVRPAAPPTLAVGLSAVITWPVSSDTFQLESRTSLDQGEWAQVTNVPVIINGQNTVILPPGQTRQFYQLQKK